MRQQVRELEELRAADTEEITQLRSDVEALVGALHQSMTENRLPGRQLADRTTVVHSLPAQARVRDSARPHCHPTFRDALLPHGCLMDCPNGGTMPRLLPWPAPEGKPRYLLTDDGNSRLSGLVGGLDAAQLAVGTDALGLARKVLATPVAVHRGRLPRHPPGRVPDRRPARRRDQGDAPVGTGCRPTGATLA